MEVKSGGTSNIITQFNFIIALILITGLPADVFISLWR